MTGTRPSLAAVVNAKKRAALLEDQGQLRAVVQHLAPQMGIPPAAGEAFVQRIRLVSWRAGERIVPPTERDDLVHLIIRGSVRLMCNVPGRAPTMVSVLGPGRFFGLASLFDRPGPRLLGAVAHEACLIGVVSHSVAMQIITALPPEPGFRLLAYSWRVLSSIIYHKSRALALPLTERLVAELRLLTADFGRPHPRGLLVDVPLRHADLAALIGCSRTNVSRALNVLRHAGLVDDVQGRLLLLDPLPASGDPTIPPCRRRDPSLRESGTVAQYGGGRMIARDRQERAR